MNQNKDHLLKAFFRDDEAVKSFKAQGNTGKKISMIWATPFFQNFLKNNSELKHNKSEGDSRRYREAGNKSYLAGKDLEAIDWFNKAILYAPQDHEGKGRDYSLALANRSASLLRLGHTGLCLQEVNRALAAGYPRELRYKLIERKIILCREEDGGLDLLKEEFISAINESKLTELHIRDVENLKATAVSVGEEEDDLTLSLTETHPQLSCFSEKIEINYEKSRGRFAVAKSSIPVGSVILVERPYASIIKESHGKDRCDNCMKELHLTFVPCSKCANVKFCSRKCSEEARAGYHGWECGMKDIYEIILNNTTAISGGRVNSGDTNDYSRLALRAITRYSMSWHKNQQDKKRQVDINSSNLSSDHGIWNLVTHEQRVSDTRLWWFLISAVCNLRTLQLSGYFGEAKNRVVPGLTENEVMIGGMMADLLLCLQFNTHSVTESTDGLKRNSKAVLFENKIRPIGSAIYPNFALLNHSCDQNTSKYFAGDTLVVVASKNISAGEEVTENYFPMAQVIPRAERRSWLSDHYWFDCLCSSCQINMPSLENISTECTKLVCGTNHCTGLLSGGGRCSTCGSQSADLQIRRNQIRKLEEELEKLRLSMDPSNSRQQRLKDFEETTKLWGSLESSVRHPYKGLYRGEQVFWKALRITFGNKAIL